MKRINIELNDMATIWWVDGEYSGYRVMAAFDRAHEDDAQAFAVLVGGEVEEKHLMVTPARRKPLAEQSFLEFQITAEGCYPKGHKLGMLVYATTRARLAHGITVYQALRAQMRRKPGR